MNTTDERSETTRRRAWLASLLMRRESSTLGRLAVHLERLRHAPRSWRRCLQRQLAATLTGAALLLAMSGVHAQPAPAATINVFNGEVTIAANSRCSLREAIINANNGNQTHGDCAAGAAGHDVINLPSNGNFAITDSAGSWYGSPTGLPLITSSITVVGNDATIRRNATNPFRLMAVGDTGYLGVYDTTLSNGFSNDDGGAIYSGGGNLTIVDSTIIGNHAEGDGGGVARLNPVGSGGYVSVYSSQFRNNHAEDDGGALYLGIADIYDSPNVASVIYASVLEDNSAGHRGGAIYSYGHNPSITFSTIASNTSGHYGGGLSAFYGEVNIHFTTISDNRTLISGGGLDLLDTYSSITNSTLSGNEATGAGSYGGGIYHGSQQLVVTNSTITGNRAGQGGGIYTGDGTTLVRNLISGNTAPDGPEVKVNASPGAFTANSHNLFGHSGNSGVVGFSPGATDIVPTVSLTAIRNPNLANNGNFTKTHALVANSPALDAAPSTACSASPTSGRDQRFSPRNQNGKGGASANECDIGAFEAQGVPPPPAHIFLSPTAAGTVSNIQTRPEDILRFDPVAGSWSLFFDGSDVGLSKALSSFSQMANGDLLLSFKVNVTLAGLGTVTPWDVVRFDPISLGSATSGSFHWHIDGSDVGMTAAAEKLDALDILPDGRVLISTTGALSVPKPGGGTLKMQDEDVAAFTPTATGANTSGTWALYLNGTAIPGMGVEDVGGVSVDPPSGYIYVSLGNAFNVDGVSGDGKDIIVLKPVYGGYKVERVFRGPNNGFNLVVAGLDRQ